MSMFFHLSERRVDEAVQRGVFDDLPRKGQPLAVDLFEDVPEEVRSAYTVLRAAGFVPEPLERRRAMLRLEDLLRCCADADHAEALRRELRALRLAAACAGDPGLP